MCTLPDRPGRPECTKHVIYVDTPPERRRPFPVAVPSQVEGPRVEVPREPVEGEPRKPEVEGGGEEREEGPVESELDRTAVLPLGARVERSVTDGPRTSPPDQPLGIRSRVGPLREC